MTAPALNPAQFLPTAAGGAGATSNAAPGGAAGAFEALMAALFPQAAPTPAASAQSPASGLVAEGDLLVDDPALHEGPASSPEADAESEADAEASDLAASLAATQTAQPPAAPTTASEAAVSAPPAAPGQDKAKGAPAPPALLHAASRADLAQKAATEGAAEAPAEAESPVEPETPKANTPNLPTQASDTARAAVQQAPARQPATPPAAADPADAPPPVAATEIETPVSAPASSTAASAPAAAVAAARPEAAAQAAPPPRADKADKKTAAAEADAEARPAETAQKAAAAKATDPAAKTAGGKPDAIEASSTEAPAEADAPDAAQPGEARAAGQSSAPAAHAAQAVRGSPETVAALAAQIVKKLEGKSTRFDVELDPAGLGKVDVRVEIGAHGRMVASLVFENPQAAQDLKARSGELQRALEQAGFDLSGGLSFDVAGERGRQGQAWQEQANDSHVFQGRAFRQALDTAGEADTAATQGALRLRRGVSAGLDLRI